jgi:hypothetical protein
MGDFAIVAEGHTDQVVIKNILLGLYQGCEEEPLINFEQPLLDETSRDGRREPGGWDLVLKYLQLGKYKQALQVNRFLVIHLDTDVSEAYGVAKHGEGGELSPEQLVVATVAKLRSLIDPAILASHGHQLLFAIAVHSIECWLLPLVFDRSQSTKRAKLVGCLKGVDDERRKGGRPMLERGDGKQSRVYDGISRAYRKRRTLLEHGLANPSLALFLREVAPRLQVPGSADFTAPADGFAAPL